MRKALDRVSGGLGSKPALIVVDVVRGFTDPSCPLGSEADEVVDANVRLMNAFHDTNLPVVLTTVIYRDDQQASVFRARIPALNLLTPESEWVLFDSRLPVAPGDLQLEKRHASSFHGTELDEWLRNQEVDSVVVTGLTEWMRARYGSGWLTEQLSRGGAKRGLWRPRRAGARG